MFALLKLAFYFGRRADFGGENFAGIDQLELFKINNGGNGFVTDDGHHSSGHSSSLLTSAQDSTSGVTDPETTAQTELYTEFTGITTENTTTFALSQILVEVKILRCSFDLNDPACALTFVTNGTNPFYSIGQHAFQFIGTYRVTDVTSISKLGKEFKINFTCRLKIFSCLSQLRRRQTAKFARYRLQKMESSTITVEIQHRIAKQGVACLPDVQMETSNSPNHQPLGRDHTQLNSSFQLSVFPSQATMY